MSKKLIILIGASTLSILIFGLLFTSLLSGGHTVDQQLKLACQWLDEGRWDLAKQLVQDVEVEVDTSTDGTWLYVKGVSIVVRASDDLDSHSNRLALHEAVKLLEQSREQGFPLGYRGKGNYYLGIALFNTYQWTKAIERLTESLTDYPQARGVSLKMIFSAQLRQPELQLDSVQKTLDQWSNMPGLSQPEKDQLRIAQARLALAQKAPQECYEWLAKVGTDSPEYWDGLKWQAIALMDESFQPTIPTNRREELLGQAHDLLKRLVLGAETPLQVRRQSFFLSGRVLRHQGKLKEAIGVFGGVRQQDPYSAEAITAALEEAEILLEMNRFAEILNVTRHLLNGIKDTRLYNEFWISIDELRTRLINIGNALRESDKFELAIELADQLKIAFPPMHALRLQATTLARWAKAIELEANAGKENASAKSQEMFGHAGERYEQLSALELQSMDYLSLIWNSAEYYQKANRIDRANRMLEAYLKYENRTKRARALLALGRNYATVGNWPASLELLQRCLIDYPTNPSSYEARLLTASVLAELNDFDTAIEALRANLWDYELNPESPVWRESFVELGSLLHQQAHRKLVETQTLTDQSWESVKSGLETSHSYFLKAADQLGESVQRYPDHSRVHHSHYLLARSYQLAAQLPRQASQLNGALSSPAKRKLRLEEIALLEKAAGEYRALHQSVGSKAAELGRESMEASILRNSHFGEADMLQQLGSYDQAIESYRVAAGQYPNQPETLEALVQIAECHRKMGRETEARKALRQAELVLQRIPNDFDGIFVSHTRGDRQHWQKLLGTLKEWN